MWTGVSLAGQLGLLHLGPLNWALPGWGAARLCWLWLGSHEGELAAGESVLGARWSPVGMGQDRGGPACEQEEP